MACCLLPKCHSLDLKEFGVKIPEDVWEAVGVYRQGHMQYHVLYDFRNSYNKNGRLYYSNFFLFTFFIKRSKESGTTASKQQNSETTTKLTNDRGESKKDKIVENNQTQKDYFDFCYFLTIVRLCIVYIYTSNVYIWVGRFWYLLFLNMYLNTKQKI